MTNVRSQGAQVGFTLLELLVSLTIIASLLVLMMPNLHALWVRHQLRSYSQRLVMMIQLARSYALRLNSVVTLCASMNGESCDELWVAGWLIHDEQGRIMRYSGPLPTDLTMSWRSSLGRNHSLRFAADGFTLGQRGSFYLCHQSNPHDCVRIIVQPSGNTRVE